MAKIVLDDVTNSDNISKINENFTKIETELNDKVLYRNSPVGEPNTVQTDVDINGKRLFNLPVPTLPSEAARLQDVTNAISGSNQANLIVNVPAGTISSTNVQAAINEIVSDLAASSGAGLMGFNQGVAGAENTTVEEVLREVISIKRTGAVLDGVTDDAAAFQVALNTGMSVFIPKGTCKVLSEINVNVSGTRVYGSGIVATRILQGGLSSKIFNVTADDVSIFGLSLDYDGTPIAGATAIDCTGDNPHFYDFKVNRCHQGIKLTGSIIGCLHDFKIYNYVSAGLYFNNSADHYINNFLLDAISATNGALGGIFINNFGEALCFSNGDVLNGVLSIQTAADIDSAGFVPAHNSFSGIYFDGSAQGSYLTKCYTSEFVNCWFSAGRSGGGYPGADLQKVESLTFTNTRFVGCGSHGCSVSSSASRTTFNSCSFLGNSQTSGVNVSSGLYLVGVANNVTVIGCTARNTYFAGTQKYGIEISNSCSYITAIGNNVQGNGTDGIFVGSSITNSKISDNQGYNPVGGSAITVGASPFTYTPGPSPETIYIAGGTVSGIVTQGVTVFTSTDKTVNLGPNESVQVTYSSSPFMNKVVH